MGNSYYLWVIWYDGHDTAVNGNYAYSLGGVAYITLHGRGVLVYGWIFINGLLNGMVLRTVQPQSSMRFILHIHTELPIGVNFYIFLFICRGVLALEAERVFGIF